MLVLRSGGADAGRWVDERRDVAADFQRAFGHAPARLTGLAIASDTDNTGEEARAGFADFPFRRAGRGLSADMTAPPMLSIIVPTLNEADGLGSRLAALAPLRARGAEIIVADGGSDDGTAALAQPHADRVVAAPRGRARQMNAGAAAARGECLLFLHADTRLTADADRLVETALADGHAWGPLRCRHRRPPSAAAADRPPHEPALAPHRHRHRRPGDVRQPRRLHGLRRLSRHCAHGGHRAEPRAEAHRPTRLPATARAHFRPALGPAGLMAHRPADVAIAPRLFFRRRSGAAGAGLRLCEK
ncbi:MAG: DUF3047 domain-containing protein [Rhodocyclaceae bacterium]|nr:DUF3047 domain-containing protein [Rhodocyclaceae bacterium]